MNRRKYDILDHKHVIVAGSLLVLTLTFLTGCFGFSSKSDSSNLVVINVLDPSYYQDCHIQGSINIPFEQFKDQMPKLNKDKTYVIYCSNYACTAAPFAVQQMLDAGFKDVALLPGGIVDWYQKKLPCNGPGQLQYLHEDNQPFDEDGHASMKQLSSQELFEKLKSEQKI